MPRLCHETIYNKLDTMTYLNFLAEPGDAICEKVAVQLDFLGIWGDFDTEQTVEYISWTDLDWWKEFLLSLWAPEKMHFKLIVHTIIGLCCMLLGLFYRHTTITGLHSDIESMKNKTNQTMQQLWSTMEEKLDQKTENEKLKVEKEQAKRDLKLIEGENENLKTKAWGLERNVSILQADRAGLESKIRDLLNASCVIRDSAVGGGGAMDQSITTQDELRACKKKMIQLQGLVKSLIEHTKQKDATLISAFQNGSQV
jgi:FtsZ-binding cell division protein ZapB